jgi:hypothetical protein
MAGKTEFEMVDWTVGQWEREWAERLAVCWVEWSAAVKADGSAEMWVGEKAAWLVASTVFSTVGCLVAP